MSVVIVDDTYTEFNKSDNSSTKNNDTVINNHSIVDVVNYKKDMFLSTDNVELIKGNDSEEGKDATLNYMLNDIIEAEFNYNK